MRLIYSLIITVYTGLIYLVIPFNRKAFLWTMGRRGWAGKLKKNFTEGDKIIWVHCASLGEFEQGRPVIEAIKSEKPEYKILLTFFSPSGYEIRKNYANADFIGYLPADTIFNAVRFLKLVKPEFAIFVKYEFWNNYISELYRRGIPLYLISGIFRREQYFFKWYGAFFRRMLRKFTWLFVQDSSSCELLEGLGMKNITVAGDTRFDRVVQIAASASGISKIEQFRGNEKLFLAGSSWMPDEEIIAQYINMHPGKMKWIFAPHEIDRSNFERIEKLLTVRVTRFSEFSADCRDARVMIIDNIGMLSSAYRYAYIAAVGGGFGRGIHNILEAACWGVPVMFGPNHLRFREAVELIDEKAAMSFNSFENFREIVDKWLTDEAFYLKSAKAASFYVNKNIGATDKILRKIFPKDIDKRG